MEGLTMIQLKLTYEQFHDLFNALFEAEKSSERLAIDAKRNSGSDWIVDWLIEESEHEAHRYKELRRFISENREVI